MNWSTTGRPNPLSQPLPNTKNWTTRSGLLLSGEIICTSPRRRPS